MRGKSLLFFAVLLILISGGCAYLTPAPIEDGSYLTYEYELPASYIGEGYRFRFTITFTEAKRGKYEVTVGCSDQQLAGKIIKPHKKDGKIFVNRAMQRRGRKLLLLEDFGPLWVPPSAQVEGSGEGIDLIFFGRTTDEITQWNKWRVYVINASIFRGALSGTWYYDTKTGFLVGFTSKTIAMSDYEAPRLILISTNIANL